MKTDDPRPRPIIELVTDIVVAYVASNSVRAGEVTRMIGAIHAALAKCGAAADPQPGPRLTKAEFARSITHEALISFEDGRPYKSLRRHLGKRGLSPDTYREKWGLPPDYPMTAPGYSEFRSALARKHGLGRPVAEAQQRPGQSVAAVGKRKPGKRRIAA